MPYTPEAIDDARALLFATPNGFWAYYRVSRRYGRARRRAARQVMKDFLASDSHSFRDFVNQA